MVSILGLLAAVPGWCAGNSFLTDKSRNYLKEGDGFENRDCRFSPQQETIPITEVTGDTGPHAWAISTQWSACVDNQKQDLLTTFGNNLRGGERFDLPDSICGSMLSLVSISLANSRPSAITKVNVH